MIRRVKAGYRVLSERTKRNLGTYPTLEQAKERLRQVEFFKRLHQGLIKPKLRKKSLLKTVRKPARRRFRERAGGAAGRSRQRSR